MYHMGANETHGKKLDDIYTGMLHAVSNKS